MKNSITRNDLVPPTGARKNILSIAGVLLTAAAVQGGIIPTNAPVLYTQTIFRDHITNGYANPEIGGYKNYLGSVGSLLTTTGPDGVTQTDVLQVAKTTNTTQSPGLRAYFTTPATNDVNPQSYTLNFDQDYNPGQPHANYIRLSYDWKPVSGYEGFSAGIVTESSPNTSAGRQSHITATYQRYNAPLGGWNLYARGAGGINDYLTGGDRGEIYSTGTYPNLVPDGSWYHVVAEYSVPDASENYEWSMSFTPYVGGILDTDATATAGGSGTFSAGALYNYMDFALPGGTSQYTWYLDNLEADLIVVPEPSSAALLLSAAIGLGIWWRRRRPLGPVR